uniref:zinc finger protein RFP-like n=1 Tax=Euleptes europaea TaxID=460621 RepID=UPI0025424529|nr:zinc finger protein RFP-like [Euleptes europaea]
MAAGGPVKELCEEATCSICLDYFSDPVTIAQCGHSFCRDCLTQSWGESGVITEAGKVRVCEKHQKPLKLFCEDDDAPICVVCDGSKEHRFHKVIPLEEAAQKYKGNICSFLENLKKKRAKILAFKSDVVKESQNLLKQTKSDKQKTVAEFRQLHQYLEMQERHLLSQTEELEKEIVRESDEGLARLSRELSSLESLIQEMKDMIKKSPSELLQDVRSTLQRFEGKEKFETPVAFPPVLKWKIWDLWDISSFLKGVMKQFKAMVTLDPDTAHPFLILSEDRKSIREAKECQNVPSNPERFAILVSVLGCEEFTTGRYFWEITVGQEDEWAVGVARKSVRRMEGGIFNPEGGIWAVGKLGGGYVAHSHPQRCLGVKEKLKSIRVALNCAGGQVAFFDNDTAALLDAFSGASFSGETLLPFFRVREKGYLRLP